MRVSSLWYTHSLNDHRYPEDVTSSEGSDNSFFSPLGFWLSSSTVSPPPFFEYVRFYICPKRNICCLFECKCKAFDVNNKICVFHQEALKLFSFDRLRVLLKSPILSSNNILFYSYENAFLACSLYAWYLYVHIKITRKKRKLKKRTP